MLCELTVNGMDEMRRDLWREEQIRAKGLEVKLTAAEKAIRALQKGDDKGEEAAALARRLEALEAKLKKLTGAMDKSEAQAEANERHFLKLDTTLASIEQAALGAEASAETAGKTATEAFIAATSKWDKPEGQAEVAVLREELKELKRETSALSAAVRSAPPPRASEDPPPPPPQSSAAPGLSAEEMALMEKQRAELLERLAALERQLAAAGLDGVHEVRTISDHPFLIRSFHFICVFAIARLQQAFHRGTLYYTRVFLVKQYRNCTGRRRW